MHGWTEQNQVVIRARIRERELEAASERLAATAHYAPSRLVIAIPDDAAALPGVLAERVARGTVTAYRCAGLSCSAPITEALAFYALFGKNGDIPPASPGKRSGPETPAGR